MRVFKHTYTDRAGTHETQKWYLEFRDHRDIRRRLACSRDKRATRDLGRRVEQLVACRANRDPLDRELRKWTRDLPRAIREPLTKWGLLDPSREAASRPLKEHVDEFKEILLSRGRTDSHANQTASRVRQVLEGCGFRYWNDLDAGSVERFLRGRREAAEGSISTQTSNYLLQATKQFCRWMVEEGRASESPLARLRPLNAAVDRRRVRRALTVEEVRRLLEAARKGPEHSGLSGAERALLYRLALETGLRASEIKSLKRSSFDLRSAPPTVTVEAGYSKRRSRDTLVLRVDLAHDLAGHLSGRMPVAPAFPLPKQWRAAPMLRCDLKDAKVPYEDEEGRVADFHALRHTFVSNLAQADVHPKVAQRLARHSTIRLTMDRYTHLRPDDELRALDSLPDLTGPDEARATGTDGSLVSSLVPGDGSPQTGPDSSGERNQPHGPERREGWRRHPDSNRGSRICNPSPSDRKGLSSQEVTTTPPPPLVSSLVLLEREAPELAEIVRSWRELPGPVRAGVLALVRAALRSDPPGD